jgi:hypothetical protein
MRVCRRIVCADLQTENLTPSAFAASTKFFPCSTSPIPLGVPGNTEGSQKFVTCMYIRHVKPCYY